MKEVLVCPGTREELIELKDCIRAMTSAGHIVYILYDFDPLPLLDQLGARVYQDELPPVAPFVNMKLDLLVVGHQSNLGRNLVRQKNGHPWILYQGQNSNAGEWLDLHEHLFLVWGETRDCLRDWDNVKHDPWLTDGWNRSFKDACMAQLSDS